MHRGGAEDSIVFKKKRLLSLLFEYLKIRHWDELCIMHKKYDEIS